MAHRRPQIQAHSFSSLILAIPFIPSSSSIDFKCSTFDVATDLMECLMVLSFRTKVGGVKVRIQRIAALPHRPFSPLSHPSWHVTN